MSGFGWPTSNQSRNIPRRVRTNKEGLNKGNASGPREAQESAKAIEPKNLPRFIELRVRGIGIARDQVDSSITIV